MSRSRSIKVEQKLGRGFAEGVKRRWQQLEAVSGQKLIVMGSYGFGFSWGLKGSHGFPWILMVSHVPAWFVSHGFFSWDPLGSRGVSWGPTLKAYNNSREPMTIH